MENAAAALLSASHVFAVGGAGAAAARGFGGGRLRPAAFLAGVCAVEAACAALKVAVAQPRPFSSASSSDAAAAASCARSGGTHGMPSSHAALAFFVAAFFFLSSSSSFNLLCSAALWAWAAAVAWARVAERCHTQAQVVAGAVLGAAVGFLWRLLFRSRRSKEERKWWQQSGGGATETSTTAKRASPKTMLQMLRSLFLPRDAAHERAVTLFVAWPAAVCGALAAWDPRRTLEILLYNGSPLDVLVNYGALALTVAAAALFFASSSSSPLLPASVALEPVVWSLAALQLCVCFAFNEVGISIVWNALLPFAFVFVASCSKRPLSHALIAWTAIFWSVAADGHYAITDKPLTTVAHVCSVVLGCCIAAFHYLSSKRRSPAATTKEPQTKG